MAGLFGTFNIANRGLTAAQTTIDVTAHNISNANTEGYSRQRAELETTRPMTTQLFRGQLGTGVQVSAIDRIRDTFLDYQYRSENSTLGYADVRNNSLYEVETLFNEPSDTGISTLMGKFFDAFQELSKQPSSSNARTVAVQQTVALADSLNHAHKKLTELVQNSQDALRANAKDVNSILNQIDTLNKEIRTVSTSGQRPNDLMDKRDLLLDQLSYKFNIKITNREFDGIDVGPADDCGMKQSTMVSSQDSENIATRLSYISKVEQDPVYPNVTVITYYANADTSSESNKRTLKVADLTEEQKQQLNSCNLIWADKDGNAVKGDGYPIGNNDIINSGELKLFMPSNGEIAGNIAIQDDIRNYIDEINKLAKSVAFSVNAIHSGVSDPINGNGSTQRDYVPLFVNKDTASYNAKHQITNLDNTLMDEENIDASNISINEELIYDVMKLKTKTHDNLYSYTNLNDIDGEGDGARALQISQLRNQLLRIQDMGENITKRSDLVLSNDGLEIQSDTSGMTMDSYFKDIIDKLGVKAQEATRQQSNQKTMVSSVENSRQSVQGVNLDEELTNLIQFQHAYSANAKIISTLDELLDVVVNGLKR